MSKELNVKKTMEVINKIKAELNNREQYEIDNGCYNYSLLLDGNDVYVGVLDEEELVFDFKIEASNFFHENFALQQMIQYLYNEEINPLNDFVKGAKSFYSRKCRSISTWINRKNGQEKINKINLDIANRVKSTKEAKQELDRYNIVVQDFYSCLNNLCPNWRIDAIKDRLIESVSDYHVLGCISATYIKNDTLLVYQSDDNCDRIIQNFEVHIDSYSKINQTVLDIINNLQKKAA